TAMRAPVGTFLRSLLLSTRSGEPEGVEDLPPPSEILPSPVIWTRCPFFTTQPVFVHPLDVLSARTLTVHSMGFSAPAFLGGSGTLLGFVVGFSTGFVEGVFMTGFVVTTLTAGRS